MKTMLIALTFAAAVSAQQAPLDRTKIPPAGRPPVLRVPTWTKSTLANGATLMVSEKHDLPLVSFTITFLGGESQFETPTKRGLASYTAAMMSEGTKTRTGEALSNELQLLGTGVQIAVGSETGTVAFQSTTSKFTQTLGIVADILMNPTFPAEALERVRAQRLVAFEQAKSQPASIAGRVFPKVIYGLEHPFGWMTTEASLTSISREDVAAFHKAYFQPGRALVSIVGDVTPASATAAVDKALAAWAAGGSKPSFAYPPLPPKQPTAIYLVDKPGAAQSTFALGNPGPPRSTADYYALQVMNMMLGGFFQSRLNMNIREEKGYSYGVSSSFGYGKGPGAFRAGGDIVSAKSDVALIEFMKELRGMSGSRPITDEELADAKNALIQRLPGSFASVSGVNGALTTIWTENLPDQYYQQYGENTAAITKADVMRVAKEYVDLDHLAIVIVGDRKAIEAPLRATGIAPIRILDIDGNEIK